MPAPHRPEDVGPTLRSAIGDELGELAGGSELAAALHREVAGGDELQVGALHHNVNNDVTAAIHLVRGAAGGAVRKQLSPTGDGPDHWAASSDPRHWNYWRREAEVYRSDLPGRLGLGAPELIGVVDNADGTASLWMHEVTGRTGAAVTTADLVAVAHRLGRSAASPIDEPWLSRGFLRTYSASKPAAWALLDDDDAWGLPLVAQNWPSTIRPGWNALVHEREWFLQTMERLPRTVCHLDVWANNVFVDDLGELPVHVDWTFTGDGAIGEDIGNMILDGVFDLLYPSADLAELDVSVTNAYIAGMREAGWDGDPRLAELGKCASAVKYTWLVPILLSQADAADHHAYGVDADPNHLYRERGVALDLAVRWADRARELAAELGFT